MTIAPDPVAAARFAPHPTKGRSRAAFVGTLWSLLHTLIPNLSAALIFFLAATYLTPVDFGRLAIATGVVSVALALSPLAFAEALVQRAGLQPGHADAVFWLDLAFGVSAALLLVALAGPVAAWFGEPALAWLLPLVALKVPFDLAAAVPNAMIVRAMRFRAVAIRTAIASGVGAAVCVALLLAGYGLAALAASQVAISVATCLVALVAARWRPGLAGRPRHLRELAGYGVFSAGDRMLTTLRLDHLVVGALGGSALVGLLTFAQRVFRLLSDVASGALSSVVHVVLASMQAESDRVRQAFLMVSFVACAVGFPIFAGAALVIDDLIALLFGATWAEAAQAAQIFCLAGFLTTLGIVQGALIRSQGHADRWFWYQLFQQATTVGLLALTWSHGVAAMAAAVVVKSYLVWPISARMTIRQLGLGLPVYLASLRAPSLSTAGMAAAVLALPAVPGWSGLALQVAVGAVVYGALLALLDRRRIAATVRVLRHRKGPAA